MTAGDAGSGFGGGEGAGRGLEEGGNGAGTGRERAERCPVRTNFEYGALKPARWGFRELVGNEGIGI